MRISDWSSDVCSSDLRRGRLRHHLEPRRLSRMSPAPETVRGFFYGENSHDNTHRHPPDLSRRASDRDRRRGRQHRSEEHTSELQSLMRISYAVFCLKKKKKK